MARKALNARHDLRVALLANAKLHSADDVNKTWPQNVTPVSPCPAPSPPLSLSTSLLCYSFSICKSATLCATLHSRSKCHINLTSPRVQCVCLHSSLVVPFVCSQQNLHSNANETARSCTALRLWYLAICCGTLQVAEVVLGTYCK